MSAPVYITYYGRLTWRRRFRCLRSNFRLARRLKLPLGRAMRQALNGGELTLILQPSFIRLDDLGIAIKFDSEGSKDLEDVL